MDNNCGNCKHWQYPVRLRDRTDWADCCRVIVTLQPKLLNCYNQIDEVTREYFKVPFSPHDIKYWVYNERFMNLYNNVLYCKPNEFLAWIPVRRYTVKEEDMKYDQQGAERMAVVKLHYFQTNKDYVCNQWEEK